MATKVKGEAIKEGSIPMSALATEVKDKIENAGGGADWNAQEGEAGYIKNRTHYHCDTVKFKYDEYVNLYETDYVSHDEGPIYIEDVFDRNKKYEIPTIETSEDGMSGYDWSNALTIEFWDDYEEYYGEFKVGYNVDNSKVVAIYNANEADVDYDSRIKNMKIFNVVQIESEFIPNTIARKSDIPDIDPVVWKYMCEPYAVQDQVILPEELRNIIVDEDGHLRKIASKLLVIADTNSDYYNIGYISSNSIRGSDSYSAFVYDKDHGYFQLEP